jgi:hypothetical protein
MISGAASFLDLCSKLSHLFSSRPYKNRHLARAATYFWDRVNCDYKQLWKNEAATYNQLNQLTGKRKMRGFWLFAKVLEECMVRHEQSLFYEIWQNLLVLERRMWNNAAMETINVEVDSIVVDLDNMTL